MTGKKFLLFYILVMIVLAGCVTEEKSVATSLAGQNNPIPTSQTTESNISSNTNTYPMVTPTQETMTLTYPNPSTATSSSDLNPEYFVDQLNVVKPSGGNGVITGQLLIGGDETQPYLTTLYLASIIPANTEDQPPRVNFSINNDPIATQEKSSGRFMFTDIAPGQYL